MVTTQCRGIGGVPFYEVRFTPAHEGNGSSEGTAADLKCSLKYLMEYGLFPEVKRLVGPGGKYEGYLPVW